MPGKLERHGGDYHLFDRLLTAEDARQRILEACPSPAAVERVPLHAAAGRVLAVPAVPADDLPPFSRSTVDGYAVRAADTAGATGEAPVTLRWAGEISMGEAAARELAPGEAITVATGGMLPPNADAVVMVEDSGMPGRDAVDIYRSVEPGANILPRGADVRAGSTVVAPGTRLRPPEVGVLAAAGIIEAVVYRRPRVAIISTGDELTAPYETPGPGKIRDTNTFSLAAAASRDGAEPRLLPVVPDRPAHLAAVLDACGDCDLILVSGGSSVGVGDATLRAVESLAGAQVLVHGVAIKPGKPTLAARWNGRLVVGMPGNPVSALVIYELFVRPALDRLAGMAVPREPWRVEARLTAPVRRPAGREEWVRVALHRRDEGYVAEPVPGGSGMLYALTRAGGLLRVPFSREGFEGGERVQVWVLPG